MVKLILWKVRKPLMSEQNKITILGEKERQYLAAKSAAILPKNPSEQGWNWEKILKTLYEPLLVLYEWLKQTQDQTNDAVNTFTQQIENILTDIGLLDGRVETLESEVDDIVNGELPAEKANKATGDEYGNRISTTYATQNTLDDALNQIEVTGDIVAKKAERDSSGRKIEDSYASQFALSTGGGGDEQRIEWRMGNPKQNLSANDLLSYGGITLPLSKTFMAGLMSSTDKTRLNNLWAVLQNSEDASFVDTITEMLAIFANYPEGVDIISKFGQKVDKSTTINGKDLSTSRVLDADDVPYDGVKSTKQQIDTKSGIEEGATYLQLHDLDNAQTERISLVIENGQPILRIE